MINMKDKELRRILMASGIIYDPWKNSGLGTSDTIFASNIVNECKRCYELLDAMADYLGVEAHKKDKQDATYVFVKKNSAEARKLKAKKAARDLSNQQG
jgi:hypothetical protein